MQWIPFGKNILVKPELKDKVIGDKAMYRLYGEVLAIGDKVEKVKKGDIIGWTLFGIEEIVEKNGDKIFLVQENDDFILAIKRNEA